MSDDWKARVLELEIKLAFQEKAAQELNEEVFRQNKEIDRLKLKLMEFETRLQSAIVGTGDRDSADLDADEESEIPPHY